MYSSSYLFVHIVFNKQIKAHHHYSSIISHVNNDDKPDKYY